MSSRRSEADPSLRLSTAQAYRRVGDIREALNRPTEAAVAYRKAAALYAEELGPAFSALDVRSDNAGLWKEVAALRLNLWVVLEGNTEQQKEAEQSLHDARAVLTKLAAVLPKDSGPLRDLAGSYNNEGIRYHLRSNLDQARAFYRRALDTYERLDADILKRPDCQLEIAKTEKNLGATFVQAPADTKQAEQLFTSAATRLNQILEQAKAASTMDDADLIVTAARKELGQIHLNLGILAGDARFAKARGHFTDAIDLYNEMAKASGDVPEYRYLQAIAHRNRADLLTHKQMFPEAKSDFLAARDLLAELKPYYAGNSAYRLDWARASLSLGEVCDRLGARLEAETAWKSVLTALDDPDGSTVSKELFAIAVGNLLNLHSQDVQTAQTARRWPDVDAQLVSMIALRTRLVRVVPTPETRGELASTRLALAKLRLNQESDYRGAAKSLADFPLDLPTSWGKYRVVAAVLGRCMIRADGDLLLAPQERESLQKDYRERCLVMLRLAVAQEWRDLPDLDGEDFKLLRNDPVFQELVRELKRRQS